MVKELHEQGGFNILAFESGLYDNYKAQELYRAKQETSAIFKKSVGSLYAETSVFDALLAYIEEHPTLKIAGFDSQESYLFQEYFLDDLRQLLQNNDMVITPETYTTLEKVLVARDLEPYVNNKKDSIRLYKNMHAVLAQLHQIPKKDSWDKLMHQTFKSVFADMDFSLKALQKELIAVQNPRDKQMAENLIFLKEVLYPNQKIIGWGASYHFANRIDQFQFNKVTAQYVRTAKKIADSIHGHATTTAEEELTQIKSLTQAVPMGKLLKDKYGSQLFSLAFTAFTGTYDDIFTGTTLPVLAPPDNSIEQQLHQKGAEQELVFLQENQHKTFCAALGYIPLFADWSQVFDGLYYINNMYPPKYTNYQSVDKQTKAAKHMSGFVVDDATAKPLPDVEVYFGNGSKSTLTDHQGQFLLVPPEQEDYLYFSALGYATDSIKIASLDSATPIRLNKAIRNVFLKEVVVTAKAKVLSPQEILKKARKNIATNYIQEPYNQKALFKVMDFNVKDSTILAEEALIDLYNPKGMNGFNRPEANIFGEITHLRNNTDRYSKRQGRNGAGSLWVLLNRDIILSKSNVLHRSKSYDLAITDTITYGSQEVYKISFKNNSPGAFSTGYGYPAPEASNGVIYIDTKSYAVLRYEHCVQRTPFKPKKSKNTITQTHNIVQTYKQVNGKYFSNLFKAFTKTVVHNKEKAWINSYIHLNEWVSQEINTHKVQPIKRPIINLKRGYKPKKKDPFWVDRPFNLSTVTTYKGCSD